MPKISFPSSNPIVVGQSILIVDDEEFNLKALSAILQFKLNIDILTHCSFARNGQEAYDMIKSNIKENNDRSCSYKLILMDYDMPVLNGPDATSKIREHIL